MADKPTNPHLEKIEPNGLAISAIGRDHFGNPIPQAWYTAAKEVIAYICPASQCLVPELDVRKIMLAVEPGPDGTGKEVYAKSVEDVIAQVQNQMYSLLTSETETETEYQRLESQLNRLKQKYLRKFENQPHPKPRQA